MNLQTIDWSGNVNAYGKSLVVPPHTMKALQSYIEDGAPPGDFLRAVMSNDLTEAFAHADDGNFWAMQAIVIWVYNNAPMACRGKENIKSWVEMHRQIRAMKERNEIAQGGKEDGSDTVQDG